MTDEEVNAFYLAKANAMFGKIEGAPCVHVDAQTGEVYVCNEVSELEIDDDMLVGFCAWQLPSDARPDELTDSLAIGSDLLDVGDSWWFDIYFNWYLVFEPALVQRSLQGDHSWVAEFLRLTKRNRTIPRPPPADDKTHLLPDSEALSYYG